MIRLRGNALLPIVPLLLARAVAWDLALITGAGSERIHDGFGSLHCTGTFTNAMQLQQCGQQGQS